MKWEEVYKKSNTHKFAKMTSYNNKTLVSNIKNFWNVYGKIVVIIVLVTVALTAVAFKSQLIVAFFVLLALIFMLLFSVYYSTYRFELKEDGLTVYTPRSKDFIKREDLLNIYLDRDVEFMLFIPIKIYSLNILYKESNNLCLKSLSTVMLKKEEVLSLFDGMTVSKLEIQDDYEKSQNKKLKLRMTGTNIMGIILLVIGIYSIFAK